LALVAGGASVVALPFLGLLGVPVALGGAVALAANLLRGTKPSSVSWVSAAGAVAITLGALLLLVALGSRRWVF